MCSECFIYVHNALKCIKEAGFIESITKNILVSQLKSYSAYDFWVCQLPLWVVQAHRDTPVATPSLKTSLVPSTEHHRYKWVACAEFKGILKDNTDPNHSLYSPWLYLSRDRDVSTAVQPDRRAAFLLSCETSSLILSTPKINKIKWFLCKKIYVYIYVYISSTTLWLIC